MGPLVRAAGDNLNYMGRVMTAKAILPFMEVNNIIPHCLNLLQEFQSNISCGNIMNNAEHYRLTECFHLIVSYHSIMDTNSYAGMGEVNSGLLDNILCTLERGIEWLFWEKSAISPTVHEIYIKIYLSLLSRYFKLQGDASKRVLHLFGGVIENCEKSMQNFIQQGCRVVGDLGHSLMYKSFIELLSECYQQLSSAGYPPECSAFINFLHNLSKIPIQQFDN